MDKINLNVQTYNHKLEKQKAKAKTEETVFKFIQKYISENGYAPCVREVCKECEIKSTATAFNIINHLKERGLLDKSDVKRRAISLKNKTVTVPLVGTVAAGQPILASQNYEDFFALPENIFAGEELFMLTVKGDSMIKIGIFDGDKVVVEKQQTADNGDIVVALVEDSATVKRFFKRGDKIILHPENDDMNDFIFDNVEILGKVVGLIRKI